MVNVISHVDAQRVSEHITELENAFDNENVEAAGTAATDRGRPSPTGCARIPQRGMRSAPPIDVVGRHLNNRR